MKLSSDEIESLFWENSIGCSSCKGTDNDANIHSYPSSRIWVDSTVDAATNTDPTLIERFCEEVALEADDVVPSLAVEGESAGWGLIYTRYDDILMSKECKDVIANCTLCVDSTTCLKCDDNNLLVNKFHTKLQ